MRIYTKKDKKDLHIHYAYSCPPDLVKFLRSLPRWQRSKFITDAIRAKMEEHEQKK